MIPGEVLQYTTVRRVQAEVGTSVAVDLILDAIRSASSLINRITDQWFAPLYVSKRLTGDGMYVAFPNRIPILRVETISRADGYALGPTLARDEYFIAGGSRRRVDFRPSGDTSSEEIWRDYYPEGFGSLVAGVQFTGYTGYLDPIPRFDVSDDVIPIQTTTATVVSPTSSSLRLASSVGILPLHFLVLEAASLRAQILVDLVDYSSHTVSFDAFGDYLGGQFDIGTVVKVFGGLPRLIEKSARRLAVKMVREALSAGQPLSGLPPSDLVTYERTEAYEYRLASPSGGNPATSDNSTGDAMVDNWISNFMAGPSVEFA